MNGGETGGSGESGHSCEVAGGFKETLPSKWHFPWYGCSPSKNNSHSELLEEQGVNVSQVMPNREEELASVLQAVAPTVCIFDRCASLGDQGCRSCIVLILQRD